MTDIPEKSSADLFPETAREESPFRGVVKIGDDKNERHSFVTFDEHTPPFKALAEMYARASTKSSEGASQETIRRLRADIEDKEYLIQSLNVQIKQLLVEKDKLQDALDSIPNEEEEKNFVVRWGKYHWSIRAKTDLEAISIIVSRELNDLPLVYAVAAVDAGLLTAVEEDETDE